MFTYIEWGFGERVVRVKEEFAGTGTGSEGVSAKEPESPILPFPGYSPGVEECWMELDQARMRYLRAGSGPPLVLLHGLLGYSFSWRYAMPALAPYATVYAPDMLGAGFSDRPPGLDHSARATAQRLLRFVAQLGISSFDLLGTSRGGAVAMMAAAECVAGNSAPKLNRLILVAPVNPYSAHGQRMAPFFGSSLGSELFRLTVARMRFLFPYWHGRLYADQKNVPRDSLAGYLAPFEKPGLLDHVLSIASTWTADLRELETILPTLAAFRTLLMWGDKDPAVSISSAEPLAKYFPDSELVIFPGVGHLPYEECPAEFNRALIKFLTREISSR
jgi:pimeloyl-ACP methyl ester carboxylesterase